MTRRAAVVSIGDELVLGQALDTNAVWISARLTDAGWLVAEHLTLADDLPQIASALRRLAASGFELAVVTGGLGPTPDDLTRAALADATGSQLVEDAGALEFLEGIEKRRGRELTPERRLQALRPAAARIVHNPVGTAPGLAAAVPAPAPDGREPARLAVFCLPGPPREMHPMFDDAVGSFLAAARDADRRAGREPRAVATRTLRCIGVPEADAAAALGDLLARGSNPEVGTTASDGVVSVRIRATGSAEESARLADEAAAAARERLGDAVFGQGDDTIAGVVLAMLRERGDRLVVAESCTAGLLAAMVADVPGSSDALLGGWIAYANEMKSAELAVEPGVIGASGAVSEPVAFAMARGALERAPATGHSGATHALSITGVAGPGHGEKPPGTVWIGRASSAADGGPADAEARLFRIAGDRSDVRTRSATTALTMLLDHLRGVRRELTWEIGTSEKQEAKSEQ